MTRRPGDVVGGQVRHFRRRRGWTQEELVRRLSELGIYGWRQSKIAKIERGEARRLPVDDVLELALALGCPPIMLLAPDHSGLEPEGDAVEVAPGHVFPSRRVRDWIRGRDPLVPAEAAEREQREASTFYYLESQPARDWIIGEDDFRFSATVKLANEAREALLEQEMNRFDAEMGRLDAES